jgi:hypothetical protein
MIPDAEPDREGIDARADARRDAQEEIRGWWPKWAKAAGIDQPPPTLDIDRPF